MSFQVGDTVRVTLGEYDDENFRESTKREIGDDTYVVIGVNNQGWPTGDRNSRHYDLDVRRVGDNAQFRVCACVMERTNVPCPFR